MIEVVFNEAIKATMKMAKSNKTKYIAANKDDIVNIGNSLDIGDISGEFDSLDRQEVFKKIWGLHSSEDEVKQFFNSQRKDLEKLLSAAKEGKVIRIWESNSPFSACGFAFVCHLLKDIDCKIKVVSLPEYHKISSDTIVTYTSWSEIAPGEFYKFLSLEKDFSEIEKTMHAYIWEELKEENASLRAVVNGKLISVPEGFYDHLVTKNIPEGEFLMVHLIGQVLGKYQLGVGDSWFTLRINKMIEENKLEVVSKSKTSHPLEIILKKVLS